MNLPRINNNSPSRRKLTSPNRLVSSSTNSKSTTSSASGKYPLPILVQLCFYPDEAYACRTMRLLLSSRYSPNVCDEFGCNVLMYSLRYQRYRLFDYLLKNASSDLNFQAKDRHGNTILHYAIMYSRTDTQILEKLIEIYKKLAIRIDERNHFGFTPLLLAAFSGRYDFVWALLTKADASPFVRDHIQLKNMFDYIDMEVKHQPASNSTTTENKRLIYLLHQTLPSQRRTYAYKNFFETCFHRSIDDQSNFIRLFIIEIFHSDDRVNLLNYLNQRYPRIQSTRRLKDLPLSTRFPLQQETSKVNVHNILNLFDPTLKPKAEPPPEKFLSPSKGSLSFKRLSRKISTVSAFAKMQSGKKDLSRV